MYIEGEPQILDSDDEYTYFLRNNSPADEPELAQLGFSWCHYNSCIKEKSFCDENMRERMKIKHESMKSFYFFPKSK